LSKIEAGKMEAFAEDLDVGGLLKEVVDTASPLMDKNSNRLELVAGDGLGQAHQDVTKIRQSLLNLLSNAAKFTHEGTIALRASRDHQGGQDWLTFAVRDTGIGIPADKIETVFEEFGQADNSTTRDYGGTGLGLPISRKFCRLLGGDISINSQPGSGSTFVIRVPAVLPGSRPATPVAQAPEIVEASAVKKGKAGAGRRVLVIDDDAEARDIIERILRKDGFEVSLAQDGEAGLRLASELHPDVITLDVMMPGLDGWSVLRQLKASSDTRDIPVVMLTIVDDKSQGFSLGATDYLSKPIDREQLKKTLARYCTPGESRPVLLVEDNEAAREIMAKSVTDIGWQVAEAANGREALDKLSQQKPGLILLDLMMPVMDGFEFLVEMRAHDDWRELPVIVLTAKDLTEEDRRRLSGRVEQIIEKGAQSHEQVLASVHDTLTKDKRASAV
ncbi:MAG: response regulator, partial [Gammaproteobacteria bacterium]